jgi:crotonobetainyl-CoA:carnitine CoA-transferase CaiB-like acyl-CoA transferase
MVWVSLPAYGMSGPYKYHKGYGANVEAIVGHTWLRGYSDSDPTTTYPVYHADAAAASGAALAALVGLWQRRRTGRGQHIDISQAENVVHHLSQAVMDYSLNGRSQSTLGNGHPWMTPHDIFPCAAAPGDSGPPPPGWPGDKPPGDDRWVAISIDGDAAFARLCTAIARPELAADPRFATNGDRVEHRSALRRALEARLAQRSARAWAAALTDARVPAGVVNDIAAAFGLARDLELHPVVSIPRNDGTSVALTRNPITLSATPATYRSAPPRLR